MDNKLISDIRNEYIKGHLQETDISDNPILTLTTWFADAVKSESIDSNAFVLSTIHHQKNTPTSRVVLLKQITEKGISFFTNYASNKGKDIDKNANVAGNFFWPNLERQIRFEGIAKKISELESHEYFNSRPLSSRQGAIASHQSEIIQNREVLDKKLEEIKNWPESQIKKPPHWGGYEIEINYIEFWQGRSNRLHDRIACKLNSENIWNKMRLSP